MDILTSFRTASFEMHQGNMELTSYTIKTTYQGEGGIAMASKDTRPGFLSCKNSSATAPAENAREFKKNMRTYNSNQHSINK